MIGKLRYALLAVAFLSTLAMPYWTRASETQAGLIILAEANSNDPNPKNKGKPQQKTQQQNPGSQQKTTTRGNQTPPGGTTTAPTRGNPPKQTSPVYTGTPPGSGQQTPRNGRTGTQNPPNQVTTTTTTTTTTRRTQTGGPQTPGGGRGPNQNPQVGTQTTTAPTGPGTRTNQTRNDPRGRTGAPTIPQYVNVDQLRNQRKERREGNLRIFVEPGNRSIVRDGNRVFVRHDERDRFRRWDSNSRVERRGGETFTHFRRGGYEIIDVTGVNGQLLRRLRRGDDGREVVLIDNRRRGGGTGFFLTLAPPVINIPRERYIVDVETAPPTLLYDTLDMDPLVTMERPYSLDEVRYNVTLRDRMSRLDINTINFESGSWLGPEQANRLSDIAAVIQRILGQRPNEIFLIEGHTDAVGNDTDNLSLSDRRAESVAAILTENFQIPPENLTTQGYGSQFLKVPTQGPSRENRRVAVRRITPLLVGQVR